MVQGSRDKKKRNRGRHGEKRREGEREGKAEGKEERLSEWQLTAWILALGAEPGPV